MKTQTTSADRQSASWQLGKSAKLELRRHGPLSEQDARAMMKDRIDYMRALFQNHVDPYWGKPDPGAGRCLPDQFKVPQFVETDSAVFIQFDVGATAQFVIGTCVDKDETNFAKAQLIYCKKFKTLYDLRYFYPRSEAREAKLQEFTLAECEK